MGYHLLSSFYEYREILKQKQKHRFRLHFSRDINYEEENTPLDMSVT